MKRLGNAIARAIDILIMHGPVELVRRGLVALLGWALRGWWP